MFAKAADGRLQECIARVGRKDEGSLLLVALRCVLNGSNHEIMISVGKTSCSLPLQMRDVYSCLKHVQPFSSAFIHDSY